MIRPFDIFEDKSGGKGWADHEPTEKQIIKHLKFHGYSPKTIGRIWITKDMNYPDDGIWNFAFEVVL